MENTENPFAGVPVNNQAPASAAPQPVEAKKSHKKLIIILSSVGGFIILCAAAVLIWWFAYFDNDNALLSGAFNNLLTSKGGTTEANLKVTPTSASASGASMTLGVKGSGDKNATQADITLGVDAGGINFSLNGSIFYQANGDLYAKVSNLSTVASIVSALQAQQNGSALTDDENDAMVDYYTQLLSPINGKWIKVGASDLQEYLNASATGNTGVSDLQKCVTDVGTKISSDQSMRQNLLDALKNNGFLNAKRVGKDSNGVKYELTLNSSNASAFVKAVTATDVAKQLSSCAKSAGIDLSDFTTDTTDATDNSLKDTDISIYFWVDRGSRQARRAEINATTTGDEGAKIAFVLTSDYKAKSVTAPSGATDIEDVIKSLSGSTDDLVLTPQDNQSDSARQRDVYQVVAALTTYAANNMGYMPTSQSDFSGYLDAMNSTVSLNSGSATTGNILITTGQQCDGTLSSRSAKVEIMLTSGDIYCADAS